MKIHLIAIGGAVMHNLALELQAQGHEVSGSDDILQEPSRSRLEAAGMLPAQTGWFPEKIHAGLEAIILGMHARADNPELRRAQELGLAIYSFPEFVYRHAALKKRLVVAGSHGKTTITAMVMHVLKFHKCDFDYLVGSQLAGFERMVRLSEKAPVMVIEGDEYLSSPLDPRPKFLHYQPQAAVISGVAWDHINVFPTYEQYLQQFRLLCESMLPGAVLGYFEGDADLCTLVAPYAEKLKLKPYKAADYVLEDGYVFLKTSLGKIPLQVFGRHNIENIAAARLLTAEAGISKEDFYQAIASFPGTARRLECILRSEERIIYRDFAHAPSKVMATVKAVREMFPNKRLTAVLELHTFSSLNKDFLTHYAHSLQGANRAVVYYSPEVAASKRLEPFTPEEVRAGFAQADLEVVNQKAELHELLDDLKNEELLLLMSSGTLDGYPISKLISV
jgi:UDP-N-acetylmuramate: L-alanyl-gamma-D-glutamyl-meso-diaminopimelate ligase